MSCARCSGRISASPVSSWSAVRRHAVWSPSQHVSVRRGWSFAPSRSTSRTSTRPMQWGSCRQEVQPKLVRPLTGGLRSHPRKGGGDRGSRSQPRIRSPPPRFEQDGDTPGTRGVAGKPDKRSLIVGSGRDYRGRAREPADVGGWAGMPAEASRDGQRGGNVMGAESEEPDRDVPGLWRSR